MIDNYLAVILSQDLRRACGERHRYYVPFDGRDAKSIATAERELTSLVGELKRNGIDHVIAMYAPCDMFECSIIASDYEIDELVRARVRYRREFVLEPKHKARIYGPGGRIGEVAA